jgi:septum formation protein
MNASIILASLSPRRADLLKAYGITFEIIPSQYNEYDIPYLSPTELALAHAVGKGEEVANRFPNKTILAADTVIDFKGVVLGKPPTLDAAETYLMTLSGKTHQVITGVAIYNNSQSIKIMFVERTEITFKPLTKKIINNYFSLVSPLDKAGAYGIQEYGEMIIQKSEGDLNNVIGLPVNKIKTILETIAHIDF